MVIGRTNTLAVGSNFKPSFQPTCSSLRISTAARSSAALSASLQTFWNASKPSRPAVPAFYFGDGALNYRREKILEAYYAYSLNKWATLTFDYQFINNPGYNADREPVSIFLAGFTRN